MLVLLHLNVFVMCSCSVSSVKHCEKKCVYINQTVYKEVWYLQRTNSPSFISLSLSVFFIISLSLPLFFLLQSNLIFIAFSFHSSISFSFVFCLSSVFYHCMLSLTLQASVHFYCLSYKKIL